MEQEIIEDNQNNIPQPEELKTKPKKRFTKYIKIAFIVVIVGTIIFAALSKILFNSSSESSEVITEDKEESLLVENSDVNEEKDSLFSDLLVEKTEPQNEVEVSEPEITPPVVERPDPNVEVEKEEEPELKPGSRAYGYVKFGDFSCSRDSVNLYEGATLYTEDGLKFKLLDNVEPVCLSQMMKSKDEYDWDDYKSYLKISQIRENSPKKAVAIESGKKYEIKENTFLRVEGQGTEIWAYVVNSFVGGEEGGL